MPWTDAATVADALAGTVDDTDPWLERAAAAADAWARRKRVEAGYDDTGADDPPSPDVGFGTTLYAVALYRERAATDGYPSFQEYGAGYPAVGGSLGQIRRLLGVGKGAVDAPPAELDSSRRRWPWR